MDRTITFCVGPAVKPVDAMARSVALVRRTLPMLLGDTAHSTATLTEGALAVINELVDITARHRIPGTDLTGHLAWDGTHALITIGDMDIALPPAEEEPGMFTVRNWAESIGQHRGDRGGWSTWAAVRA
ncbi:hypothetical protein GTY65_24580 [Streptomyces sp. SID8379]|uniref:hypothetical protein n=1 Tax=unclassified Streptomyces TaxID=2593676 RepID=UPI000363E2B0|nr:MULTISPECIES: hypothetical protein [unclassified Streptomyces]MYW67218.1 hypothetical protein [Streptomyces sp. SID8379]